MSRVSFPDRARQIARLTLNKAGLKYPPVALRKVAEFLGVKMRVNGSLPEKVDAFLIPHPEVPVMVVKKLPDDLPPSWELPAVMRMRFTVAHELGHFALRHYDKRRNLPGHIVRREANEFAGELLMPTPWLKKAVLDEGVRDLRDLQGLFLVSASALAVKLREVFGKECLNLLCIPEHLVEPLFFRASS